LFDSVGWKNTTKNNKNNPSRETTRIDSTNLRQMLVSQVLSTLIKIIIKSLEFKLLRKRAGDFNPQKLVGGFFKVVSALSLSLMPKHFFILKFFFLLNLLFNLLFLNTF
jgi:hypothetical protein